MTSLRICQAAIFLLFSLPGHLHSQSAQGPQQVVDPTFRPSVNEPAYATGGPIVAIDEAHSNFHTAGGQYKPFADLLRSDGYVTRAFMERFSIRALTGISVLVVANALGTMSDPSLPAFSEAECDAVMEWVRGGGALLLIADHAPFGSAAENLARRFGITMGKGWAFDQASTGITTQLIFSRANGLLGSHAILQGRNAAESISTLRSFTGQSVSVPDGAAVLMQLSATAREARNREDMDAEDTALRNSAPTFGSTSTTVGGRAQGVAMIVGNGRVVVLGEAGMLSAQLIRFPDGKEMKFGLNVPGNDNQQFALNVVHWLSRLLD